MFYIAFALGLFVGIAFLESFGQCCVVGFSYREGLIFTLAYISFLAWKSLELGCHISQGLVMHACSVPSSDEVAIAHKHSQSVTSDEAVQSHPNPFKN